MRKTFALLATLVLCAAPVTAQQSGPSAPAEPVAAAAEQAAPAAAPSLFPTRDEVRSQVRAAEESRGSHKAVTTSTEFIALVAAIVLGVVIAALLLD